MSIRTLVSRSFLRGPSTGHKEGFRAIGTLLLKLPSLVGRVLGSYHPVAPSASRNGGQPQYGKPTRLLAKVRQYTKFARAGRLPLKEPVKEPRSSPMPPPFTRMGGMGSSLELKLGAVHLVPGAGLRRGRFWTVSPLSTRPCNF